MTPLSEPRSLRFAMAMLAFIAALATVIVVGRMPTDQNATIGSFVASSSCQPLRLAYPTATPSDPAQNFGELYLPPPGRHARSGLVVLVHGGGWQSRLGGLHGLSPLARDLADEGLAVYNIEYRRVGSGGGWPTTLLDARDAATYAAELQSHNPQLQGPLIIVGHSAGGHLAVWAAQHQRSGPAPLAVSVAGPLDLEYAATQGDHNIGKLIGGSQADLPIRFALADPSSTLQTKSRVLVLQGTDDHVVPIAVARHYLNDVNVGTRPLAKMITIKGATHTSLVTRGRTGYTAVINAILSETKIRPAPHLSCSSCGAIGASCGAPRVAP